MSLTDKRRPAQSRPVCAVVGAGPGVGAAVARRFGREGFALALIARRRDAVDALARALTADGATARGYAADAADAVALQRALTDVSGDLGAIEVLVYNAVAARPGGLAEVDAAGLLDDLHASVAGVLTSARAVVPGMEARGRGTLLVTGGGVVFRPPPGALSLAAGKSAVRALALSLAAELAPHGVRVATVTIAGGVAPRGPLAPDRIADVYWTLHAAESPGDPEVVVR